LLAVDDLVEGVVEALAATSTMDNTYIFYWSDHGYHLGSFQLAEGKMHFYEFDTRVPFLMRGPGIVPGFTLDQIVGNIDLAPTFLAIAQVDISGFNPPMDGRSVLPLVVAPPPPSHVADGIAAAHAGGASTPACIPDPCNGHGVCLQPLKPQCFCNSGYAGERCQQCAAGHESYPFCSAVPWREQFLFEYYPIANFESKVRCEFSDRSLHSRMPSDPTHVCLKPTCVRPIAFLSKASALTVVAMNHVETLKAGLANHVRINDNPENTFRALRIHNATHDIVYAELTTLQDWGFEALEFFELYDMRIDPFQLDNIYPAAAASMKAVLHADLVALWGCVGKDCP
jgi:hypothetical protein